MSGHNSKGFNSAICLNQNVKRDVVNPFFIIPHVPKVRARCCTKCQKIMLKASKLWMPRPQDFILQHLLELEGGPEGYVKKYQSCLF